MEFDAKIKELQEEANKLIEKRNQLTEVLNQLNVRLIEIQGAFKTLQSLKEKPQELPNVKPEDKTDVSKKEN